MQKRIDIILPVYNQFELTRDCLNSVLSTINRLLVEVVVVNDASTETDIGEFLRTLAAKGDITLIDHVDNRGFTRSANEGMALHPDRDVILLNSDTVVYGDWVERLHLCAYSDSAIATVNPLTNFGGSHIAMYPQANFEGVGELIHADLDAFARVCNAGRLVNCHTTVGFCMFIKRTCIKDIGYFDGQYFPRAYGEEADFCYRASYVGWKHAIATNVFVSHFHGMSFGEEKASLMSSMLTTFGLLHPRFAWFDQDYWTRDPLSAARREIDVFRLTRLVEECGNSLTVGIGELSPNKPAIIFNTLCSEISFSPGHGGNSYQDLPTFDFPKDIVLFAHTLRVLNVRKLVFSSAVCLETVRSASVGQDYEIDWETALIGVTQFVSLSSGDIDGMSL